MLYSYNEVMDDAIARDGRGARERNFVSRRLVVAPQGTTRSAPLARSLL
jgi:hypothetical protein